jgi:hypothetical protein
MIRSVRVTIMGISWLLAAIVLLGVDHDQPPAVAQTTSSTATLLASGLRATTQMTSYTYLPLITNPPTDTLPLTVCVPTGETYGTLDPIEPATGDVAQHPDMNLAVRGYVLTPTAYLGLVDYAGNIDPDAPQLYTLFDDQRTPIFNAAYQVYRWDWNCNCRGGPITKWDVTLLGMETTPGELIHLPVAGYDVGGGYGALVLYAEPTRLTLKYTREDNVVAGYTIHLENICVDENLLALYEQLNAAGRSSLPALFPGQPLGRAPGAEIDAATRDSGAFLDPRARKDWWQGR